MNFPDDIDKLERELQNVRQIVKQYEDACVISDEPEVEQLFLASTRKLQNGLESHLRLIKSERAYEVLRLRLDRGESSQGTIRLRTLLKLVEPLNTLLEQSAWRVRDKSGTMSQVPVTFIREVNLRLASIETGSTQLVLMGNTTPDLTGESALESALRNIFELLNSKPYDFIDHIHAIGMPASKSLAKFMALLEREEYAVGFQWNAPDQVLHWEGNAERITNIRSRLDVIGEPTETTEQFDGVVNVLSIRNRIEIERADTGEKIRALYHKSLMEEIQRLRLGEKRCFKVKKTAYDFIANNRKQEAYNLIGIMPAK
jgi:hypothetical protein